MCSSSTTEMYVSPLTLSKAENEMSSLTQNGFLSTLPTALVPVHQKLPTLSHTSPQPLPLILKYMDMFKRT